jgi:hypothetical protein
VLARRIELLEQNFGCAMLYSFAIHEAPSYKAESFNPDVHDCDSLAPASPRISNWPSRGRNRIPWWTS